MDATRRGKGGGWVPHALEFMENTVLSTSWLKLGSLSARARCLEISQCTFPETVATVLQRRKQRPQCSDSERDGRGHITVPAVRPKSPPKRAGCWWQTRVAEAVIHISTRPIFPEWPAGV